MAAWARHTLKSLRMTQKGKVASLQVTRREETHMFLQWRMHFHHCSTKQFVADSETSGELCGVNTDFTQWHPHFIKKTPNTTYTIL